MGIVTVHSSSFCVPCLISASQGKQYSKNTDYMRQNGTVRQMTDPLLVKFMCRFCERTKFFVNDYVVQNKTND